ncbi:MAG: DNA-3-methyladenine glycosylase 2 family protein [Mesorhizobium sp.]|nr:DNA-3-methyladenine glycosylase 2 family protein [Mesorhizobium sp.]MCO5162232.1 DNA-3-methyladenine glycosylase 2 family protein [Mesorhizobium sp.]
MRRISSDSDIVDALDALVEADSRLAAVRVAAGPVPLRLSSPGFSSLVSIVVSQQVSRASAEAILGRLVSLVEPLTPGALLAADPDLFRQAGLSRPKQATILALSRAVRDGLDLDALCAGEAEAAIAELTAIAGIGRWTAEVYLLACAGHPDVFPARDVALQSAVGAALGIDPRPGEKALIAIAESWAPWRAVAARLFWAYYRQIKGREAAPAAQGSLNLEKN